MFGLGGTAKLSYKVAAQFRFPPALNESSCCSTCSLAFGVISGLDFAQAERRVVVPPWFSLHFRDMLCWFSLHLPDKLCCEASIHMLICYLFVVFGEVPVKVFVPVLNQNAFFPYITEF